jgi:Coenzyme PQQ synthesis protein D (PqqD)
MIRRPAPQIFARDFDGELVLLDLDGGEYFGLNSIGKSLWEGLLAGKTVTEITEALAPLYDVTPAQLRADLAALEADLLHRGFLA